MFEELLITVDKNVVSIEYYDNDDNCWKPLIAFMLSDEKEAQRLYGFIVALLVHNEMLVRKIRELSESEE